MKTVIALLVVVLAVSVGLTCPERCVPINGVCACDETPLMTNTGIINDPAIVSDEKPSRHPQPAYERGEVIGDMPQNLIAQDSKRDAEILQANLEGMKNAGLEAK